MKTIHDMNPEKHNLLSAAIKEELLNTLKARFEKNMHRHSGINWEQVRAKLEASQDGPIDSRNPLMTLSEMERTGGEPDVIGFDAGAGAYIFCDCSPESPAGRRSLCYDREALDARKENKPESSAMEMAAAIGIEMLTVDQYKELQKLGKFDTKTSSWIKTPDYIRKLGGAIFAEYRYGHVFIFHNSAPSYYAARGFRGMLRI